MTFGEDDVMRTLARFVTKYYKAIMIGWIALFIAMAFFALRLPGLLAGDGFRMDAEHERVMKIASETFDLPAETMFVVFDNVTMRRLLPLWRILRSSTSLPKSSHRYK